MLRLAGLTWCLAIIYIFQEGFYGLFAVALEWSARPERQLPVGIAVVPNLAVFLFALIARRR